MTILEAIARMEGFYQQGSRPQRNNNPGDIEWGAFARAHGATHAEVKGRFAVFPSAEVGFEALRSLLQTNGYRALTVAEAIDRYAPPAENQTNRYIALVCQWASCSASDRIANLVPQEQLNVG